MNIRLGDWSVILNSCTQETSSPLEALTKYFYQFQVNDNKTNIFIEEATYLVIASMELLGHSEIPVWLTEKKREGWKNFYEVLKDMKRKSIQSNNQNIPSFSWPNSGFGSNKAVFNDDLIWKNKLTALVLNNPTKDSFIEIYLYLLFLVTIWHINHGGLCLHSSAICKEKNGFLFLGKSESGKTTVAQMSADLGYQVLGDDLNIVSSIDKNHFCLAALPSPNLSSIGYSPHRPPLRGIFILEQDDKDFLVPISQIRIVKFLYEGLMQMPKSTAIPKNKLSVAFHTMSKIARQIPAYELHFRKSPDFWKVIDSEFPPSS